MGSVHFLQREGEPTREAYENGAEAIGYDPGMLRAFRQWLGRVRDMLDPRGRQLRRLTARVQELKHVGKLARRRWETEHASLKEGSATRLRRIPSPDVLRDLLPLRARTLGARARDAGASEHEARLLDTSPAYGEAIAGLAAPGHALARTRVQGLTWWVPVLALNAEAGERFVEKQRFPYRNITQTRELAVGPVLLDIGANVGRMSIPRVVLGDFQRAYCAEPDPLNYTCLVRNVAENGLRGLVLPDQMAIGSARGTARLQRAKYSGGHRLLADVAAHDGAVEVPCWSMDEWCRRLAIDLDLVTYVKVDTQGWEVHVLSGASDVLARDHIAWQLEVAPALLEAAGTSVAELYALCGRLFTSFIDLGKEASGPRVRRTADLDDALRYLAPDAQTDIVLFRRAR